SHARVVGRQARILEHRAKCPDVVVTDVALEVLPFADLDSERREHTSEALEVHVLVVDEHAVVVEKSRNPCQGGRIIPSFLAAPPVYSGRAERMPCIEGADGCWQLH